MLRFLLITTFGFTLAGCSTKTRPDANSTETSAPVQTDPWPVVATTLRKQPDLGGARQVVSQLTADLANNPAAEAPLPLSADAAKVLGERLRLSPAELKEVAGANYTNLDAAYIAECLFFRDVVRSLDLGNHTPERKAMLGFAWVCRQIYLKQGVARVGNGNGYAPPIPPQYVLHRGYGTGLERAWTFLAMLSQLGLEGGLVGPPDREHAPCMSYDNNKPTKGPFWAVAARLPDGNVALFDPWRGLPLPGPNGSVATLAQVQANPDQLKPWIDDKENPWDVTMADLKAATVYLAVPYPAVTPRLKLLEQKVAVEVGAKLYRDPIELLKLFGDKAKLWATSIDEDRFTFTRNLATFLPIEEGGTDATQPKEFRLYEQIVRVSHVPYELFSPPAELQIPELQLQLKTRFIDRYLEWVFSVNPREKIQRGQFNEIIRVMVERDQLMSLARQRGRATASADVIAAWAQKANEMYQKLSAARLPQNAANLPAAQAAFDQFWAQSNATVQQIEDTSIVPACQAEAGLFLAICKHEQAERASIRLLRTPPSDKGRAEAEAAAKEAWAVAKDAWGRYQVAAEPYAKVYPERTAHYRRLAERAARLAANPASEW